MGCRAADPLECPPALTPPRRCRSPEEDAQLEIFLVNGKSVTVDILSTDQTDDVLEAVSLLAPLPLSLRSLPASEGVGPVISRLACELMKIVRPQCDVLILSCAP